MNRSSGTSQEPILNCKKPRTTPAFLNTQNQLIVPTNPLSFSIKALCKLLDVEFSFSHFVDEFTVVKLSEKIGIKWPEKKEKLLTVLPIVLSYSDRLREIARYGVEDKQKRVPPVSPNRIFQQEYGDKVLNDAKRLVDILSQIEKSFRWNIKRICA